MYSRVSSYLRVIINNETLIFDSNIFKNLFNVFFGILFTLAVGLAALFFLGVIIIVGFDYKIVTELEKATFITIVSFAWMAVNFLMAFQFKKHRTFFYTIMVMCVVLFINTTRLGIDAYQKYENEKMTVCSPDEV